MPYTVVPLKYGPGEGIERPTKKYAQHHGDLLTPDEIAVWEYVKWLEAENKRVSEELADARLFANIGSAAGGNDSPPAVEPPQPPPEQSPKPKRNR
jgi:hypothetical protein